MAGRFRGPLIVASLVLAGGVAIVLTCAGLIERPPDLSDADIQLAGENSWDYAGVSVASAGDVNGDGFDGILVGAYLNGDGGGSAGKAYLFMP